MAAHGCISCPRCSKCSICGDCSCAKDDLIASLQKGHFTGIMTVANARKTMRDAFEKDPHFRYAYQANIAMAIYDDQRRNRKTWRTAKDCNVLADELITLIFDRDSK